MRVGVVVLNWNNAALTLDCLRSLLALPERPLSVYVVDNGSTDGSLDGLLDWLGHEFGDPTVEGGRASAWRWELPGRGSAVLVGLDRNLGYAAGNNAGIRVAIADGAEAVWVLNNDTTVAADALQHLVECAHEQPDAAVIGACLLEWSSSTIQALGGARYIWPLTLNRLVGRGLTLASVDSLRDGRVDYVAGASMFIPTTTFHDVGLLNEGYFLYGEELDYAERCRARGKGLAVARKARVWHRYGASAGSSADVATRSITSAYYGSRSAVMLVRRFRRELLPIVLPIRCTFALLLFLRARPQLAGATFRGVLAGLRVRLGDPPTLGVAA